MHAFQWQSNAKTAPCEPSLKEFNEKEMRFITEFSNYVMAACVLWNYKSQQWVTDPGHNSPPPNYYNKTEAYASLYELFCPHFVALVPAASSHQVGVAVVWRPVSGRTLPVSGWS